MQIAEIKLSKADINLLEYRKKELYNYMHNEYNNVKPSIKALEADRKSFVNISNWLLDDVSIKPFKRK